MVLSVKAKKSLLFYRSLIFPALCILFLPDRTAACDSTSVRDGAFGEPRSVHLLGVMARAGDPAGEKIYANLDEWCKKDGQNLNLELRRVDPDDPEIRWEDYGIPSCPPSLPVTVLAGKGSLGRANFLIYHWEPGPSAQDLEILKTSPAREKIREEAVRRLAVLIHVPASEGDPSGAGDILSRVARAWSAREPMGVAVITVDRDDRNERLLLSFMGVKGQGLDCAAVVFGRGKMMVPLKGEEISEAALNNQLETLVGRCTCLQSPASLGVDIPLVWEPAHDLAVVPLRGAGVTQSATGGTKQIMFAALWTLGGIILLAGLATVWLVRREKGHPL
jgi:hypothetical protein